MSSGARQLTELTAGGFRWQVAPEWRDALFGAHGLRLEEWLRAGLARVVKHGPHRTVYHVTLPDKSFYLKHYRLADLRAWLRQLVRPAKARIEFERALAVAERSVPTVAPVAMGQVHWAHGPGDSFLITRGLDGAEPISMIADVTLPTLDRRRQTRLRQRLAVALGEFVARLHDEGIVHHDLHAANLLVCIGPEEEPSVHLVDLHAVHLGRPLGWRDSRDNLILLNRWFVLRAGRTDRLRFWLAYCRARTRLQVPWLAKESAGLQVAGQKHALRGGARNLETRTWKSNLRFWQHRDRRCLVRNRYYTRCHSAVASGHAVRDLDVEGLHHLLADPDGPFRQTGQPLLKDSRSSTVTELDIRVNGEIRRVIYKRFRITSRSEPWKALARRSPALRSWIYGHGLRERCLPTARPLAVFHRRHSLLPCEGYLLMEKIPGAVDLHAFLAYLATLADGPRRRLLRHRIDQVARLVCGVHLRQLSHRDLKASNILLTPEGIWLIDLVGITPYRRLSRVRREQNVARLHASFCNSPILTRTDKLRFLRAYLQWGLRGKQGWKSWWHAIERATQVKQQRNARNGRPLT